MMGCVEHGESIWYAVVSVEILSDSSVESGVLSKCGPVWDLTQSRPHVN